jgi:carbonic anhydrase/acetyltransferase-like protein (isoleucine patch superfamily)
MKPDDTIKLPYPDDVIDVQRINTEPTIAKTAWIAPGSIVTGDVIIGEHSSVWYNTVIRGDSDSIRIGDETNIQDGCVLHVDTGTPCILESRVSLGHRAIVHASVVEEESLIGMNATVLSRCHIGRGSLIAAGAVVPEDTQVPPGTLWAGIPARQIRPLSAAHRELILHVYRHYVNNAVAYLERERRAQSDH